MNCETSRRGLACLLVEDRPSRQSSRLRAHLADCPACRAELAALAKVEPLLRTATGVPPPDDLWARVTTELDAPPPRRLPRLVWAGAGAAAVLLLAVALWPRAGGESDTPYLRDHYQVVATAPFGNPAMGDVLQALATETP